MRQLFKGNRVLLPGSEDPQPACVLVEEGVVTQVSLGYNSQQDAGFSEVVDAGDHVLMPGVVDCHVHVNEPGRVEWEGYETATRAAAAGGITTIVDMPLNSIPSTTSQAAFKQKLEACEGKLHVDVGFWGGVVPGNQDELEGMVEQGVCGFKCFMIHSGVDEFEWTREQDIREALAKLQGKNSVLLFHAELDQEQEVMNSMKGSENDPCKYSTFLATRPASMEVEAIRLVSALCKEYRVPCHIVHLSAAEALPIIRDCKASGAPLTVETTHHYLCLAADDVPDKATQFKCCPPIRDAKNQNALWEAVKQGDIDMVVSDHSPCTEDLKLTELGDFTKAWGGIASVQFGLSLLWTSGHKRGLGLQELVKFLTINTSSLAGLSAVKGAIQPGHHADFVIWDPDKTFVVKEDIIQHKNKLTPYMGQKLHGVVHKTFVRGINVFDQGNFCKTTHGKPVYRK